jgi:hypothetical protein
MIMIRNNDFTKEFECTNMNKQVRENKVTARQEARGKVRRATEDILDAIKFKKQWGEL